MGPMGGAPPRPPVRQGTSRVVPVVVSAGLAVGVFCGLLFGLGTGKRTASAEPQNVTNGAKRPDDTYTPEQLANVKDPEKIAPKAGSNTAPAVPSAGSAGSAGAGAGSAGSAGAGAGSDAASPEPAIRATKLIVEIKPDSAAQTAKILVDGKEITGTTTDIAVDPGAAKKTVKVLVKSSSYKDIEKEVEVEGESITLKLELTKTGRSAGSKAGKEGTGGGKGGKGTGGKGKGSGGLIDI
jgi:hypothetical protein